MDKIFKRAVSILVALVMTIVMIPANAFVSFADEELKGSDSSEVLTAEGELTEVKYQKVSSIDTQSDYLIVYQNGGTSVALNNKGNSNDNDTSINITKRTSDEYYDITNVENNMLWNFNKEITSNGTTDGVKITNKDSNSNPLLKINNGSISMESTSDDGLYVSKDNDNFTIYNKITGRYSYYYLNYYYYKFIGSRTSYEPTQKNITIYKKIESSTQKVTYTLTKPTKLAYRVGQSQNLKGGKITVTDESGNTIKEVNLSDNDVEVTGFTSKAAGMVEISVKYEGKTFKYFITVADSTVTPVDPSIDDEAQYPNQGSVKVNKGVTEATKENFENTGLARLELGVKGVPSKKGVDAVLVIDVSNSMNNQVGSTGKTRLEVAKESAKKFIEKVLEDNVDGSFSNNRIALVTFGFKSSCLVELSNNETTLINAVDSISINNDGTDYDAGVQAAYNILNSVRTKNYNREQAVLFLSDGAPTNGYNDYNNEDYNEGWHNATYNEIEKNNALGNHKYSTNVKKLPATMYTVGFGLADSNGFTQNQAEKILRDYMATSSETFYSVQSAGELTDAFEKIGTAIKKAGTNAVVTDKMGPAFNLQMGQQYPSGVKNATFPTDFDTTIKVSSYKVDSQGNRTGEPTNLETVTFSKDGSTATSDQKTDTNIIKDNKIQAKYFTYDLSTETFTWNIGDITQDEIVLSYPIYLENSMEGTRGAGNYDTNESAILNYTNINDKSWHKDFEVPSLPWKSANVKIEYYLVNEAGEPINSAGTKVPWEYRVTLSNETRPLAKGSNLNIKASDNVPGGYVLHNKDAFYKIDKVGRENAVRTYSDSDISTKVTGKSPYTTSSVAFGVMTTTDLTPDTIVLDYGKPVTFNVLDNDGLKDITTLTGVAKQEGTTLGVDLNTGVSTTPNNNFTNEAIEDYGKLVKKSAKGDVTYTLSKYMDGIDKFYYEVTGKTTGQDGKEEDFYKYSSISVIPATSVYYEDNFGDASTNDNGTTNGIIYGGIAKWEQTPENVTTTGKDEQDSEQGKDTTYGQDSSYANDTTFSYGSAHVVTATEDKPAMARFSFKGTGFEIISRTDNNTGSMTVMVYNSKDELVKSIPCNTVYKDGTLYQIPVISVDGLDYDKYEVIISVTGVTDQNGVYHGSTVYIDGLRIFNPIDPNGKDDDAIEANKKYKEDNEANQVVYEIRNLLLDNNSLTGGTDANGVVYIDSKGNITEPNTYKDLGPNNEVYLKKGNSIGFKLRSSQPAAIKIGLKTPDGKAGKVTVGSSKDSSGKPIEINTATSMYYDVTNKIVFDDNNEAYVVIKNSGDTDAIVSLTKIKFTFEETPAISPKLVVNQKDAQHIRNLALSINGAEVDDNNKDNTSNDRLNSDSTTDKPNNNTSIINQVVNFFKNLFRK